jgi:sugar phosphate isomerase/epimerase
MKIVLRLPLLLVSAVLLALTARADFHDHVGLQLYSLRANTLAHGLPSSLDLVKGWGITEVEGGLAMAGMTPEQMRAAVDARGLTMPSAHAQFDQLTKDLPGAVRAAQALGLKLVVCPWIPHEGPFDRKLMQHAAEVFNQAGEAFGAVGIKFGYHPHGYEFIPNGTPGETLLDDLIRATKPEDVCYEMDVFWTVHAGGDPVKLLEKYAPRWVGLHLKDIRKGAPTGFTTGHAPDTDNVAVGAGAIDWKTVIGTAEKIGVKYYFIEDETPDPLANIPASLAYLRALKL